jgi:hypothetical protein
MIKSFPEKLEPSIMAKSPYSGIAMDHTKTRAALEQAGVEDLTEEVLNDGKLVQYRGTFETKVFLMKIFVNGKGKCTIGSSTGLDPGTFDVLAEAIANHCKYGDKPRLELSIPNFKADLQKHFLDFVIELGAKIESEDAHANYRQVRIVGPLGDNLTVKFHSNGTLQLQGSHAQLAVWALDFLKTVLPLDDLLAHQKAVYALPLTVAQIKSDLTARVPVAHDWLGDTVRMQFTSALALTKIGIELEDYAALAFPALRGLEGFSFQLLQSECGLKPATKAKLGEYFEPHGAGFCIRSPHGDSASVEAKALLAVCYKTWHDQRHRLFHMDGTVETTRILGSRTEAVTIVEDVLTAVESGYVELIKSKGKA